MEHVRGDDELLQDILAGVEAASWACAILFSLWVVGLGRKPTECAETGLPKKLREGLHGQWFEIAGTHGFPGRGLRSALRRDPSRYSLSFQFTNTGTDVMDAVMTTTDCPEDGGSPSDKHVIHVLSKESKPSRDKLIRCMQVVLGLGFSLQDLGPLSNCQYVSQKSAFSTVRRYGILTSRETKFNSEAGFNMSYNYARGRRGTRQTEQSTAERTDQSPGSSAQKESGNPVSPEIFRDQVDNDLEYRTFAKFFDGCVRGEQRFVADFIDREPLWTLARHKRTLWTGLHFAAYNGYSELVSYFLGKGSNPCARSARGESPLAVALNGMLRHIGERMRWDDGSSCVFDLREGDETYSHKPHSLERYEETVRKLHGISMSPREREAWGHIKRDGNNLHTPEFPIVHSQFSMHHVLVMDMMEGCVPLLEYLAKPTFPIKLILTRLGRIHLRNEFMDGLVHCDLHPGNIMIRPDNGRIVLLDFGLVGELTESDRVGTTLAMLAGITSHADVSVDVFLTNYIQDSEFVFADPDLRARFVVAMLPLFRTHMSTSGSWDFAEFSADYTRVLTDFDLGLTSCWYTLEMSVIHIVSTLALLQPEAAFKDAVWQLLHAEHEALLNNIAGSEYYDRLEGPLRRKFEWAKIFQRNS
ncbi:Protein ACTIVITY OF BC1 COMPLEX KINASE 3, chloroplastic [Hondaea fermentalgiana]|uniref:Protein ACTIVITY OF BC1 COMPLEX KINASE 3, chloroplastic n=1 Tax=Hondaea fermentalgiana TaxID=2315210 RepID=A0A2R5GDQ8_9STRA|nr:Protein ACTIVITY OF BC1 COMPLEX KINASE 3, chloroplastic [Hondaea fermentalgiana]|eukprot:GBG29082.1 Protein ACTIVITY OF BC1 COMPLEX KINASE 3, chloroplastic [Hondaea fermentalgiana]